MNPILDDSLVGLVLLMSAGYALSALGPKSVRRRGIAALSGLVARAPAFLRLSGWAVRLGAAANDKAAGACGGCGNCGSEKASASNPSSEVRIAVTKIGRRA